MSQAAAAQIVPHVSADAAQPPAGQSQMTLRGAVFLGVGGMVGAGIFALLGEAGEIAGAAVWVSFLVAGLITTCLGYALVKLGVRYPSKGGLITYLIEGFGNGRVVGVAAWLGYLTAIVVVAAMVAISFGDYASSVLVGDDAAPGWSKFFASLLVVATALLTRVGVRWVDRAQTLIVVVLLAVFAIFIVATIKNLNLQLLAPSRYPSASSIISSIALTFFAYLGFAVISFAAGDMAKPKRDLPRAMYLALGITTVLYVTIALSVFGTLPVAKVIEYGPTAIAEAARPTLGDAGFTAMVIAALLATSSSVLATLYASVGFTEALAEVGQFPPAFGSTSRLGRSGGLMITVVLTLLFVNLFGLGAIASIGSAVSLAVFVLVGLAGFRLRHEIGASVLILAAAVLSSAAVLAFFAVDTLHNDPRTFWAMIVIVVAGIVVDGVWKRIRKQPLEAPQPLPS